MSLCVCARRVVAKSTARKMLMKCINVCVCLDGIKILRKQSIVNKSNELLPFIHHRSYTHSTHYFHLNFIIYFFIFCHMNRVCGTRAKASRMANTLLNGEINLLSLLLVSLKYLFTKSFLYVASNNDLCALVRNDVEAFRLEHTRTETPTDDDFQKIKPICTHPRLS